MELTIQQLDCIQAGLEAKIFLEGAGGTGKTSVGVGRLAYLLEQQVNPHEILVFIPQRTLAFPYDDFLQEADFIGGQVPILTLGGVARRAVDIFWPLVAKAHGFGFPDRRPTFLSLETAQYYMARVIGPIIDEKGYFDTVTVPRNRLYSQIIDNLNKSAVVGFPYTDIGERLKSAWSGDHVQLKMYDDVQECANLFRAYCVEHNLLDFSLQLEIFMSRLWLLPQVKKFVMGHVKHIIADNVEEDTPAAHQILSEMIAHADSALVIYDVDAGYRRFLGADAVNAYDLQQLCERHERFEQSFVTSLELDAFSLELAQSFDRPVQAISGDARKALMHDDYRYHPQMINGVADVIIGLVKDEGVAPQDIVVLAPYMSDSLRFSLMNRLANADVAVRSHRPSRSLREEPATRCLLTLTQLAHPDWGLRPLNFDIIYVLMQAIADVDLVRAQLLTTYAFKVIEGRPQLEPFDTLNSTIRDRVTYVIGERYERLRLWMADYIQSDDATVELDHFLNRLFGEVLSQQGFGFYNDFDASETAANLIDSARNFRWIVNDSQTNLSDKSLAQEYVEMVAQGVIANQYLASWYTQGDDAVLLAPAYTFLMSNRAVDYQFWLNVGGQGWAQRLYQPLTNPYVLTQHWPFGKKWTDHEEVTINQEVLYQLTLGLIRRCRKKIYLGFSELGEEGFEQRGDLLMAIQRMLMRLT